MAMAMREVCSPSSWCRDCAIFSRVWSASRFAQFAGRLADTLLQNVRPLGK